MGYRCRWQTIGRQDMNEPPGITAEQSNLIKGLTVQKAKNFNTIYNVFQEQKFIGQVRLTMGGQYFRIVQGKDWIRAAFIWNTNDPEHAHSLLKGVEINQILN